MNYLQENFPDFDCNEQGEVFKKGVKITPFKSNKYFQVCLFTKENVKKVVGVHTVIAMKYLNYFEGCVVHHKDENTQNNKLENLEIMSREAHTKMHLLENPKFLLSCKGRAPWNKGKKMSEDFRKKCSESAKKRYRKK